MKKTLIITVSALLALGVLLGVALWSNRVVSDTPTYSNKKATDDFTDLYKLADLNANSLALVTVTDITEVTDVIEKYDVIDTLYTKITATLQCDYSGYIDEEQITILLLGNTDNFPNRETMVVGRSYLLRLESWVHESGMIWLVSPLESTYLRVHDNCILVHDSAADLNYKKALSPDEFDQKYQQFRADNPISEDALRAHFEQVRDTLAAYNYADEEMDYHLTDQAIAARKALAETLVNNEQAGAVNSEQLM